MTSARLAIGLVVAPLVVGCEPTPPTPVPPALPATSRPVDADSGSIERVPLTAEQLAQMLMINAWTAKYTGGPLDCWIEIDETGQSTMPKRIPATGEVGASGESAPTEGTVLFYWLRSPDGQGGRLVLQAAGGYSYGLDKSAFLFGWGGHSIATTGIEFASPLREPPGRAFAIVKCVANEMLRPADDPKKTPRRLEIRLMGKFRVRK